MAAVFEPHPEAAIPYHALTRAGTRQQGSACTAARFWLGVLSPLSHTCIACLQSSTVTPGACRPSPAGMACCTMCPFCPPARSASRMHAQCHLSSPWYYTTTACTTHSCLPNDDMSTHTHQVGPLLPLQPQSLPATVRLFLDEPDAAPVVVINLERPLASTAPIVEALV